MSGIHRGTETRASAYFCPKCQSPDLELWGKMVEGADYAAKCLNLACGWSGRESQLVRHDFKHEFRSDEEIADTMAKDLRNLLAKSAAQTYGAFLFKWGFLDQPITTKQLATYLEAISKAIIRSVVETRKKMVEEKTGARG